MENEEICGRCGSIIPLKECDECKELTKTTELMNVTHADGTVQNLCPMCEGISYGKHTYAHNKKVWAHLNEKERWNYVKSNYSFAYLYIKELERA